MQIDRQDAFISPFRTTPASVTIGALLVYIYLFISIQQVIEPFESVVEKSVVEKILVQYSFLPYPRNKAIHVSLIILSCRRPSIDPLD
jgi:hypothetical protein